MRITVLLSAIVGIIVFIISVAHVNAAPILGAIELDIPAIQLSAPVVPVGLDSLGAVDVPSGKSSNVGWYDKGIVPGQEGSAVIDAHVFGAFKNLYKLAVGDDLYIDTGGGTLLHFKVTSMQTYKLADVPADELFNKTGGTYLNLITCAGTFIPSQNTYDQRLVVYTTLVSD